MSESDLMEYVRADFEALGYTTYAEVCSSTGKSKRCDMYARIENPEHENYGHSIVFEAKLTFNFKVMEQANFWKNRAHDTYIIVPSTYKNISSRRFARHLCSILGIGVLEVNINKDKYYMTVKPNRCVKPKYPKLYDEQKLTKASNSENSYVTPFKITVTRINDYMLDKDKEFLTQLVKDVNHHYKTNISATRSIKFLIEKNIINGFYITKENNKLVIKKHGF
jgi:hypothetical protein